MEDSTRTGVHDFNLASRKAEEAAWRRFEATAWLESLVGPLGISTRPSERELISCLRNGLILCNAINKVQPGAVAKVVDKHSPVQSLTWESKSLPAYQYFENVRNFIVAVEELRLPAFEASDLELDNLEAGSAGKVVDCILVLKSYHEWKKMSGENGFYKYARSPMVLHSAGRVHSRPPTVETVPNSCKRLDMSAACEKQLPLEDTIVRELAEYMVNTKENIDENLLASFRNGDLDPVKLFSRIMSSCLEEEFQINHPELKSVLKDHLSEGSNSPSHSMRNSKCCRSCEKKGSCGHRRLFHMQEKELSNLKALLSNTKREFEDLQAQFENDLKQLGSQVQEMSTAALGYQRVVTENRILFNMVQDLKGNIRVYCRIRPTFSAEAKNVINYVGDDGSLVIQDPSKPQKEGRKVFQFNRVFGPNSTQDEVFKDTQSLIRSVMDGYNVCIFAYGQTGSGKTHTMCGPSGGFTKDMGINYLALNDLFQMSNRRKDIVTYDIHVQMVEIYNEQVRDLLAEDSSTSKLEIRSCTNDNGLSLPDATMHSVKSSTDVLNLMKLGEVNRVVSSTAINNRSSRSHSILTVHVHGKDTSGSIIHSCLHLVDLAGSERVEKSEVTGDRLKEAQYINKSLSCLGDVIAALAQKNSHIPYRNSKLTLLLQDSLGGHAKTLMFAHVSPEGDSFGETVGTLKFAQRVSTVELGAARSNKESGEVIDLKEQIESLKKALAKKEAQNANYTKPKESRSPCENPKTMMVRTPLRPRRLSIENCGSAKPIATTERTPSRSRRLSIENCGSAKPKAMAERTPPRSRRLSIENCGSAKPKAATERTPPRSRRLSIENCGSAKPKVTTEGTPPRSRRLSIENCDSAKPKVTTEQTPPRSRRLSIENCGSAKPKVTTEQTPPRSRRLSIENGGSAKPKATTERTPPRSHRLSIENGSTIKSQKAMNLEDRKGLKTTPSVPTRARRLSLEGPKYGNKKDHLQIKSENVSKPLPFNLVTTTQKHNQLQDAEAILKPHFGNGGSMIEAYDRRIFQSPPSSAYKSRVVKTKSAMKIPPLQIPKTPEHAIIATNEVQIVMRNELTISTDSQARSLISSVNGKGSQLKRSLRSIGKLINGSEKKNQRSAMEAESPFNGVCNTNDLKSPLTANARALRRRSLTGVLPDKSRRSSLGGDSTDSNTNEGRYSRTPPPVHPSTKTTKRWM